MITAALLITGILLAGLGVALLVIKPRQRHTIVNRDPGVWSDLLNVSILPQGWHAVSVDEHRARTQHRRQR